MRPKLRPAVTRLVRTPSIPNPPSDGRATVFAVLLAIMPLIALVPKYFLIERAPVESNQSIVGSMTFGMGDYVRNLLTSGEYRTCATPPFLICHPEQCEYATRMPVLPLLYAGLTHLVGDRSGSIAFAKCVLTALLLAGLLTILVRDARPTLLGVVLLYAAYFGPQALKHGASIAYEEGLLLDLELSLAIAVSYLLAPALAAATARRAAMGMIAVVVAVIMYFTKTTALLTLIVVAGILLSNTQLRGSLKLGAAALIVTPFIAWGSYTSVKTGAVHLSSSWNGENLFRGYNSESFAIYPEISLDRIFDSRRARLDSGVSVPLSAYTYQRCFNDEWAWNESYSHKALTWLRSNPRDAAQFLSSKLWVTLFEVRHTPYHALSTDGRPEFPRLVAFAMLVWMVFERLLFLALIVRLLLDLRGERRRSALWTLVLLAAAFAPYVAVFSYQRHVVPLLVMATGLFVVLYLVEPRTGRVPASAM